MALRSRQWVCQGGAGNGVEESAREGDQRLLVWRREKKQETKPRKKRIFVRQDWAQATAGASSGLSHRGLRSTRLRLRDTRLRPKDRKTTEIKVGGRLTSKLDNKPRSWPR